MLKIELFGPGKIQYQDRLLSGFPHQHCFLLLCYLLLNRNVNHSREQLASLFWADDTSSTSRKYLRNNFWRLRCALEKIDVPVDNYLFSDNDVIAFIESASCCLDIKIFEKTVSRSQSIPGEILTPAQASQLADVLDLYKGDLLQGVYEDWCLQDRERLRVLYIDSLSKLMLFHETHGSYQIGVDCGARVLQQDNVRERIHRRMMRLYWLSGNRDAALGQYKRCTEILQDELGIPPTQKTQQLYQQIVANQGIDAKLRRDHSVAFPTEKENKIAYGQLLHQTNRRLEQLKRTVERAANEIKQLEMMLKRLAAQQSQQDENKAPGAGKEKEEEKEQIK